MFESSKFDKSGLKSGGHIRPGPDLKNGQIPAGAWYDIRCNPSRDTVEQSLIFVVDTVMIDKANIFLSSIIECLFKHTVWEIVVFEKYSFWPILIKHALY